MSVVLTGPEITLTAPGSKSQLAATGSPLHDSVMSPLNPELGVNVIVVWTESPAAAVPATLDALGSKSGGDVETSFESSSVLPVRTLARHRR